MPVSGPGPKVPGRQPGESLCSLSRKRPPDSNKINRPGLLFTFTNFRSNLKQSLLSFICPKDPFFINQSSGMGENLYTQEYWRQLQKGNTDALSALYQLHYVGLINYGVKMTGDRDLANDCFINVLLELWDKRSTLPDVSNVRAYLITCLHRRILQEIRSDKRRNDSHLRLLQEEPGEVPYETYLTIAEGNDEFTRRFAAAFRLLTQRQQQLLRMKFFENLDYDHIAQTCGITRRTAYNIIHDALKQLKNELKGHEQSTGLVIPTPTLIVMGIYFLFH
ncbi:RNA polymerase sigma factor [Chitinophaga sp. XS-30]|nr:RNA polymerase sigma factor [Chitinophaga sp. XS-30]